MGISLPLTGGVSGGGSVNSSTAFSQTKGTEASQRATQAAAAANSAATAAWERAAAYNAEQARINREWQERMANTVYQRTVQDMKKAGINPVLAAGMGLGTAGGTSGSTASMGNPYTYMSGTFADSESASQSEGQSWQSSMNGLAYLADAIKGIMETMNTTSKIDIAINGLEDIIHSEDTTDAKTGEKTKYDSGILGLIEKGLNFAGKSVDEFKDFWHTNQSKKMDAMHKSNAYDYNKVPNQYHNNGL